MMGEQEVKRELVGEGSEVGGLERKLCGFGRVRLLLVQFIPLALRQTDDSDTVYASFQSDSYWLRYSIRFNTRKTTRQVSELS